MVFISYAKKDWKLAKKLYDDLKDKGLTLWLDSENLLGGQDWKIEAVKAIKNSSYFLALLSSNSKEGFVQKELKIALELLDERSQSQIFIIPVRLDSCTPDNEKLKGLYWIDLFPSYENGLKKILSVLLSEKTDKSKFNPFIYGKPVSGDKFLGRENVLKRILSRILTGQSAAIIGEPHIGKTSLLYQLKYINPSLFSEDGKQIIFSYMDFHMLDSSFTQAQFWELVLTPLTDWAKTHQTEPITEELMIRYRICHENNFGNFTLEQMLRILELNKLYFVLLLDEFDALIHHPILNKTEFFGGLRSLSSRCNGFVIIIAARQDLSELHNQVVYHGSPYFNIFSEVKIGALSLKEIDTLLKKRFSDMDYKYIRLVAGRHPFLLQAAAAAVWDVSDQNLVDAARYQEASQLLYQSVKPYFTELWKVWTTKKRKAFTAVALAYIPTLLRQGGFTSEADLREFYLESDDIKITGLLEKAESGQWRITQGAMLWWLTDELIAALSDNTPFNEWLQAQELDGILTNGQRKKLKKYAEKVFELVQQGSALLIEAMIADCIAKGGVV
ncbi:MAG: toll/interleukin-1 receptor domain-containing protein [Desulfobacterales bacterium]|nr:toll/interleukin-1 receptor domain-containing protein [Desulfobacterales bacterium]